MQRLILLTCLMTFVMTSQASAQQMEDVVYLKNGGLIRGTIIEQVVGKSLKIQTRDGNVFVYEMDEIAKISKEPVMGMGRGTRIIKKNPWIAFGLSLPVPGAGQVYNEQLGKGAIQFGVAVVGFGLMFSAVEDSYYYRWEGNYYRRWIDPDPDDDDWKALLGLSLWFGSHLWSIIDAPVSANRINQQSQQPYYGHLIELGGSRAALGVDPIVSRNRLGTRLTLHF